MSINELLNTMKKYEFVKDDHGFMIKIEIKKPKDGKSESEIQAKIAAVFMIHGFECVRYNCGNIVSHDGKASYVVANRNLNSKMTNSHPDLIAFKDTHAVRIEVKSDIGKLSQGQKEYAANGLLYGNPIITMRSANDAIAFCDRAKTHGIKSAIVDWVKK